MADEVTAEVEYHLAHKVEYACNVTRTTIRKTVTKVVVPSPKPDRRTLLIGEEKIVPMPDKHSLSFTERLLHHAAIYADDMGNLTEKPPEANKFVASVLDFSVAKIRKLSMERMGAAMNDVEDDESSIVSMEEGGSPVADFVSAMFEESVKEIVKERVAKEEEKTGGTHKEEIDDEANVVSKDDSVAVFVGAVIEESVKEVVKVKDEEVKREMESELEAALMEELGGEEKKEETFAQGIVKAVIDEGVDQVASPTRAS